MASVLHLDFETYSEADIRKVGLENYLRDPAFCVTVIAWAFDDGPVKSLVWPDTTSLPEEVFTHVRRNDGEIRAHNAGFEHAVLNDFYRTAVGVEQMVCTMQKALSYGLPAGLLKAGKALKLPIIKDESRRLLMLQMGRPRKGAPQPWHETDAVKLSELQAYCEDDVRAERALDLAVPDLHPWEKQLSELDHRINRQGVRLDLDAVAALRSAAQAALKEIDLECTALTGGHVTAPGSQTYRLVAWLAQNGCPLPNVAKETIEQAIGGTNGDLRRVLELRQMAARSSVAKLERMLDVASVKDSRARHLLQFAGAGRTLRWAGRLVQPQNLPKSMGVNTEQVIGVAEREPGGLGLLWADPVQAISRSLRSCFIARPGHVLVSVDLSQIEARVLAWLAGQQDVIDTFARGEDVYMVAAGKVGSTNRQLGKVLTLACGYGMGWAKFRTTAGAAPYYVSLTDDEAKTHLYAWRRLNPAIVGLWARVETAAVISIEHPGTIVDLPFGMAIRTSGGVTQIRKPNGVRLTYHNMRLDDGSLIFDGVNGVTKLWGVEKAYGGRLVENLVQAVARDVMAEDMLARAAAGAVPVMTVHDEIVWETAADKAPTGVTMTQPAWARGLPIASDLHVGVRYAK